MTQAETDVLAEREKQRAKWGDEHDDGHGDFALSAVAARLAYPAHGEALWGRPPDGEPGLDGRLPAAPEWGAALRYDTTQQNPGRRGQRLRLVIAAALLIAEIERLDRAGGE